VKLARNKNLKAPELWWLNDKVTAAFDKHGEVLFPKDPPPFWKPEEKKKKRKKKPKIGLEDPDPWRARIPTKLPMRGKQKLYEMDTVLLTKAPE
jgi:hypothetical protein